MSDDLILEQLSSLLQSLIDERNEAELKHKKLNVTFGGAFRLLLEDNRTTLTALHGSPENLVGYLLKTLDENHRQTLKFHDELQEKVSNIIKTARNS